MLLYAAVYGLSEFPTTYDQDFVDNTRIFIIGNGEAPVDDGQIWNGTGPVTPDAAIARRTAASRSGGTGAAKWVLWVDPTSGKVYGAHSSAKVGGFAGTYRQDTAVRMLEQMQALEDQANAACSSVLPPTSNANASCNLKWTAV